jgi:hypothetical protein
MILSGVLHVVPDSISSDPAYPAVTCWAMPTSGFRATHYDDGYECQWIVLHPPKIGGWFKRISLFGQNLKPIISAIVELKPEINPWLQHHGKLYFRAWPDPGELAFTRIGLFFIKIPTLVEVHSLDLCQYNYRGEKMRTQNLALDLVMSHSCYYVSQADISVHPIPADGDEGIRTPEIGILKTWMDHRPYVTRQTLRIL